MPGNKEKVKEAIDLVATAEKSLKTSWMKWRPDYEVAAQKYSDAGQIFRQEKYFEKSKEAYLKAAECYKQTRQFFYAAKSYDKAVLVCVDMNDLREVASLAEKSSSFYQQHGSPESAAQVLSRAAKNLESTLPEQALHLYQRATDVVMIEDSHRQATEFVNKTSRLHVKLKQYDQAADSLRREIGLHQQSEHTQAIGRLAVSLVLVQLAREDCVAAEKAFKEWGNYCDPAEIHMLETLLRGFDEEDSDVVRGALNSPFIKHMDVEYARLARDLPLPNATTVAPRPTVRENAAPSYVSPLVRTQAGAAAVEAAAAEAAAAEAAADGSAAESNPAPVASVGSDEDSDGGLN